MLKLSETKARQGRLGRPVLVVLVVSLLLAMAVWWGVERYGEAIAPEQPADGSQQQQPAAGQ